MENKETDTQKSVYTDEGEITLKGLCGFLKRGWLRFVIYLAVALLVVTAVYGGVKFFARSEYGVSAKIGFTFEKMQEGKNPDGSNFDKDEILSSKYVREAAEDTGLSDKILKGGNDVGDIRSRLSVAAVASQEYLQRFASLVAGGASETDAALQLAQLNVKPTEFVVTLSDYEELSLDKKEAAMYLDGLIKAYGNGYHDRYFKRATVDGSAFAADSSSLYDYLDYAELCEETYVKIALCLDEMTVEAADFVSTSGNKFSSLKNEVVFLQSRLLSFKTFVTNGNVSKDIEKLKASTQASISSLTAEKERLEEIVNSIKETLNNIKPSTVTTFPGGGADAVVTVTYPESYYAMQERLISYQEEAADINLKLKKKSEVMTALESGKTPQDSDFVTADSLAAELKKNSETLVADINAALKEYEDRMIAEEGMSVLVPTMYTSQSPDFPTLLVYIGAVLVSVAAAAIVTYALGKRGKKAKKR